MIHSHLQGKYISYLKKHLPSVAELNALVQSAQTEEEDVAIADREYDQAQEVLAALRVQADESIGEVMAQLRYVLRWLDAPSQHRIMRTYGPEFVYLEGEPLDELVLG